MTDLTNIAVFEQTVNSCVPKSKNIFRAQHDKEHPYTLISNRLLRDYTIKSMDRGLMVQILSWSDFHVLSISHLAKVNIEGRDAIRGSIERLIEAGYIRRFQHKCSNGQFDRVTYQIFEQSTGAVVRDVLDDGNNDDDCLEHSTQLDLFQVEMTMPDIEDNQIANSITDGLSVYGKADTNNNYKEELLKSSSNSDSLKTVVQGDKIESKADLLNKWKIDFNDHSFQAYFNLAGLRGMINDQEELNRFLIDFNSQHEKYAHIQQNQRLKNFITYLIGLKNTPYYYKRHLARLQAMGIHTHRETTRQPKTAQKQPINVNPFEVKQYSHSFIASGDFKNSIVGF